jgi:phospholipid/cholesterol/gamma-HCH transport system substrate-binding protein
MFSLSQSIRVGLFFIFGVILIWMLKESLSGGNSFMGHEGYTLMARFKDLQQLTVGDEVRLAGIRVGQVKSLDLVKGQAEVTLHIYQKVLVPKGSVATITTAGLLGNNYVAIQPSEAIEAYAPGAFMVAQQAADLNEVIRSLGSFGDKLNKGLEALMGTEDEPGLFSNLNRLLVDNKTSIENVLKNLDTITTKVNKGEGTLGLLINQRDLYDELMKSVQGLQRLADFANDGRDLLADAKAGKGALGVLLKDPEAATSLKNTLKQLDDFTSKLTRDDTTLGRLLTDDRLYQKAEQVLNRADSALGSMTDSAPLSAVGVAANALF